MGSRRTEDSLEVEEEEVEEDDDVEVEILAVDFRLGFAASGFNAVSRGPYSFKEAVLVVKVFLPLNSNSIGSVFTSIPPPPPLSGSSVLTALPPFCSRCR